MKKLLFYILITLCVLSYPAQAQYKRKISIEAARREIAKVGMQHQYPSRFRLSSMGSLKVKQTYFHIFSTYLNERQKWRIIVFDNTGHYMGFYETTDEPVELDAGEILFPGTLIELDDEDADLDDTDDEDEDTDDSEDLEDPEFGGGGNTITFTEKGPPDVVSLEEGVYRFVAAPEEISEDDPSYRFVQVAEKLTDAMGQRKYWEIHNRFSPRAKVKLDEDATKAAFTNLRRKVGEVEFLDYPWLVPPDTAVFPVTFERELLGLKLMLDEKDRISGLWILPYDEAFPELDEHQTQLTLPYNGRWRVLWGGTSKKERRYFSSRNQRHACEFVIADRYGRPYVEDGKRNRDYFSYGRPVLAPADGTVLEVIDGIPDHKPHRPDPYASFGNAVIIQHSSNEVSVVGHLMRNSINVVPGDTVLAREAIARCGNSGNALVPSIYYHLQDSPHLYNGTGYKLDFSSILLWKRGRGEVHATHTPHRGQYIEQHALPPLEEEALAPGNGSKVVKSGQ